MTVSQAYRPWLWCVVFLALGWSLIYSITREYWPHTSGIPLVSSQQLPQAQKEDFLAIVALGDSLLERSLPRPGTFNATLPDNVYWLHITYGGRDWREFEPLIGKLSWFQPQFILLEDQLLLTRPPGNGIAWLRKARKSLNFLVAEILGLSNEPPVERAPFNHVSENREDRLRHLNQWHLDNTPLDPLSVEFLEKLKRTGARVIVFRLPKSASLDAIEGRKPWEEMLGTLLNQMGIDFVTLGESLEDDLYYDGAHTNENGLLIREEQFRELVRSLQQ